MSPMILRHQTARARLASIQAVGLVPHKPTEDGNWTYSFGLDHQPRGVYAHPLGQSIYWEEVSVWFWHVGPMMPDPEIRSAVVIPDQVAPTRIIGEVIE